MNIMSEQKVRTGTVVRIEHDSKVLKGNPAGDPHRRELFIYLPPSYELSDERFPVVFCLSGFAGRGKMMLNDNAFSPNMAERMDGLIGSGRISPMIVVMPDCFTKYGGSQYINSTATGNYENYIADELVTFVDENFRTLAHRDTRAVMGKSSGGYGALIMAMRHADVFGMACSISGDAYFEHCYLPDIPKAFRAIKGDTNRFLEKFFSSEKKGKNDFAALNLIGMAACYSPAGDRPELPFDLTTGEIRSEVWAKWLENDPVRLVENAVENLRTLRLLFIDSGLRDEFALDLGARILSSRLERSNVPHMFEQFDDGHFNVSYRYDRSLELISNTIADR